MDAPNETGPSLEVASEWPGIVLMAVLGFEVFFFCIFMLVVWGYASTDGSWAVAAGISLFVAGVIIWPIRLARRGGAVSAAGQDVSVGPRFYHRSIERRRAVRLPLQEKLSTLPDRSAVFGVPLLTLLAAMLVLNIIRVPAPVGILVDLTSQAIGAVRGSSQQPLVLQVQGAPGADLYTGLPTFRVQKRLIKESELREQLTKELALREDKTVFIYGDRNLLFQTMARTMDVVNNVGGRPVLAGSTKLK